MNYIDLKYVNLLSHKLDRFTVKSNNPYKVNFRCPICGDSSVSQTKARGWIVEKDNSALFHCFNCGTSLGLRNLLKSIDINLYNEYIIDNKIVVEIKKEDISPINTITHRVPVFKKSNSPLLQIKKISQLKSDHPAKKYVESRRIPASTHYKLYYAPKFNAWINSIIPEKLKTDRDEPRLVLPFIDENGMLFGVNARSFSKNGLRYITIMFDESKPKIFGLNEIDFNKRYYIVEGPIDSLFLANAIAMVGADGGVNGLKNLENAVYVFDNEPRNKDIAARMERLLDEGHKVCIWPDKVVDKDVNDMIMSGLDPKQIIDQNIYSGLTGKLQLSYWRKC